MTKFIGSAGFAIWVTILSQVLFRRFGLNQSHVSFVFAAGGLVGAAIQLGVFGQLTKRWIFDHRRSHRSECSIREFAISCLRTDQRNRMWSEPLGAARSNWQLTDNCRRCILEFGIGDCMLQGNGQHFQRKGLASCPRC
jgi:hypothetical protein